MTEPQQEPLFEVISEDSFRRAAAPRSKAKGQVTEPRNFTTWFGLHTPFGLCEVPRHQEVQDALSDEEKEYRKKYKYDKSPVRMVARIGDINVCRDCYVVGADK